MTLLQLRSISKVRVCHSGRVFEEESFDSAWKDSSERPRNDNLKYRDMASRSLSFLCVSLLFLLLLLFSAQLGEAQQLNSKGNVSNGIIVYQQRCANCHGPIGMGDGELAANLPNPVPAIGSAAYAQAAIPNAMFDIITNGSLENGMPPFGEDSSNALSEQERWDVIASLFALGSSAETLLEANASINDATREQLAAIDWANTNNAAVAAQLDAGDLDSDTVNAAVSWGRLNFSADYFLGQGSVSGTVLNGTLNQPLNGGELSLIAFEGFNRAAAFSGDIAADGTFLIELDNVPADWFMRVEMERDGVNYAGPFIRFEPEARDQVTELTVYDATANDGGIRLSFLNTVLEFAPNALVVNQLYAFDNVNNQAYVGGVEYRVPDSAENISYSTIENGQFIPLQLSATGLDQTTILPGTSALNTFIRYTIPYDGEATIEHALAYPPTATALAAPEGVDIGGMWTLRNSDTVDGQIFNNYVATFDDTFNLSASGFPDFAVDPNTGGRILIRNERQELIVGTLLLAASVVASIFIIRSWQTQPAADPTSLLTEIASLDDAYAAKQIKRKAYEERRRVLLQKVRDVWMDD